jgi:hypothetical protein
MALRCKSGNPLGQAASRRALVSCCATLFALSASAAAPRADRVNLFPKLQAGQTLTYRIAYHLDKQANTQSSVKWAQTPAAADVMVQGLLRLEVLAVQAQGPRSVIHARTWFQSLNSTTHMKVPENIPTPSDQVQRQDPKGIAIEFTVLPDGRVDEVKGLDALYPEQQQAWQQWASTFAAAAIFPADGIKLTQRWKSEEPEKSPSPITGLTWKRESTYLRNEPCRSAQLMPQGEVADSNESPETCAVIQTKAALKQKSSPKNTTPEDFKLHQLHTSGTASGSNQTLLYLSLQTGLLIRSSEQADQTMDVTIAKADNSNRVRYAIHAKSNTEIFRITNTPFNNP